MVDVKFSSSYYNLRNNLISSRFETIQSALNQHLDPVLSSRRTADELARGLLAVSVDDQNFVLHWTNVIRNSNAEMAYQFVRHAPLALKLIAQEGTRQWLLQAMDIYDKEGLYPGSAVFNNLERFAREFRISHITVTLDQVRGILETVICGLAGRTLKIEAGNSIFTDTDRLFLPAAITRFNDPQKNYQLYKVMAVHLWAQAWFGTFKRPTPDAPHLKEILAKFNDRDRALKLFSLLETFRLNACIKRELPGLAREMCVLDAQNTVHDNTWMSIIEKLEQPDTSVVDTLQATTDLYTRQMPWPEAFSYQGGLNLDAAESVIQQRNELERTQLQTSLTELLESLMNDPNTDGECVSMEDVDLNMARDESGEISLELDGEHLPVSADMEALLNSIMQDFDEVPDDWLVSTDEKQNQANQASNNLEESQKYSHQEKDTFLYDEWDYRRQTYRKKWCILRELPTHLAYDDFAEKTLKHYAHLVNDIKKHFEALRGEDKVLKAQSTGDDIDLDALITAKADVLSGLEMTDRVYTQIRKQDRNLALILMVDVSGSTKGWINTAVRESLILLCQALEILGDQYAIYGFSGMTKNRCEVYCVKTFEQPYDKEVRAKISGLRPKDYTRMGVVIRHLSGILNQVEAKTRILITLSDGKPDDYDGYRGEYGIEDTRQSLLEARHTGIHPFCITIDTQASDYLPHMYGHASYVMVDEIRKLPLKVADIYRKLTT